MQTAKSNNTKGVPKFTPDIHEHQFIVLDVHGACLTVFDTTKNIVFKEHQNNCYVYPNGTANKLILQKYDLSHNLGSNHPKFVP